MRSSARSSLRERTTGGKFLGLAVPYSAYPVVYTAKIALTLVAMALVLPGYRQFRRPPGLLAVLVGAVGIFVWVGLWESVGSLEADGVAFPFAGLRFSPGI